MIAPNLEATALFSDDSVDVEVVSQSLDGRKLLIFKSPSDGPGQYTFEDLDTGDRIDFYYDRPALKRYDFGPRVPYVVRADDGLELVTYLTLPPGYQADAADKNPLPLVLCAHGGPYDRDYCTWSSWHQWLANRGYAALTTNFRGSTGLGKKHLNASDQEWGGKIQSDLRCAVHWAIDRGIADPARIGIMGGSFGGYSALLGVAQSPDLYACGISLFGISDLTTFLANLPPYWEASYKVILRKRLADHTTAKGISFLRSQSPLFHAESISKPMLIAQGANDVRVTKQESDRIVDALATRGVPVVYLVYPDEGHGFFKESNVIGFHGVAELFLAKYLGGRVEEIASDFDGSSMQVVSGEIPLA